MDALKIFSSPKFGQVRIIADDASGELLFCANDITQALGYTNGRKAVADHVEEGDVTKRDMGVVTGKKSRRNRCFSDCQHNLHYREWSLRPYLWQ